MLSYHCQQEITPTTKVVRIMKDKRMFKIYELCVSKQYYTWGTCKEYDTMLHNVQNEIGSPEFIAYDIYFHSDLDRRPTVEEIVKEVKEIFEMYGEY